MRLQIKFPLCGTVVVLSLQHHAHTQHLYSIECYKLVSLDADGSQISM